MPESLNRNGFLSMRSLLSISAYTNVIRESKINMHKCKTYFLAGNYGATKNPPKRVKE